MSIEKKLSECVSFFLHMQSQLRMYHWQTKSYARHKASDELIADVVELSDRFVESFIGKLNGTRPVAIKQEPLGDLDDVKIGAFLDACLAYLTVAVPKIVQNDSALLNVRDEIMSAIQKTKYLFTLQ